VVEIPAVVLYDSAISLYTSLGERGYRAGESRQTLAPGIP
jgi:hypothetical protein